MVATIGDAADLVIIHTSKARRAELTSSYEEEKATLLLALDYPTERTSICSDNQLLLKAVQNGIHGTRSIRQRLDSRKGPTTTIWVPGLKGKPGNEAADELAKAAATATTHLICHRESHQPTYRHRSHVQQAPNSHGVRALLLEGGVHRHLQQSRCRAPSPPTIRTHTASQGVRPLTRSGSRPYVPAVQGGAANTGTLFTEMPKPRFPPATHPL